MDMREAFDEWWDRNEKQFMADACHMSEYHMAYVVWEAAILTEREACKTLADNCAAHCQEDDNGYGANAAMDISDRIASRAGMP